MTARAVVVWGNCQAAPVADLLRAPLARRGLEVVDLPPVYLLTPAQVDRVHRLMAETAVLVSQPIRDEYRVPGCSTERLAALLPPGARVVRYPVVYHSGALPYQVTANDAGGVRVAAPLTDYHDLRLLLAAATGRDHLPVARLLTAAPAAALAAHAEVSLAELRRREAGLEVVASDLVGAADALFTLNHPRNRVLAEIARRVLRALGDDDLAGGVVEPEREYLGAIRAPVEFDPVSGTVLAPSDWTLAGRPVGWDEVAAEHLRWYRAHPDVATATVARHAARLADFGLTDADRPDPSSEGTASVGGGM